MMQRPVPVPDTDSAPFWEACAERRLSAQQCESCGHWRWPPAAVCPHCRKRGGAWKTLSGTGTISSFVVVHQSMHPAFNDAVPYTIAFVALDEAPDELLLLSNLVECRWEDGRVGMRVTVTFEDAAGGALPVFRPA